MKADKLVIGALAVLVIASLVAFALMVSSVLVDGYAVTLLDAVRPACADSDIVA